MVLLAAQLLTQVVLLAAQLLTLVVLLAADDPPADLPSLSSVPGVDRHLRVHGAADAVAADTTRAAGLAFFPALLLRPVQVSRANPRPVQGSHTTPRPVQVSRTTPRPV